MAVQGTYYLDAPSLSAASVIYTDPELTTVAPDGFYSDGSISREQASGVLLPQVTCPSCNNEFLVGFGASTEAACGGETTFTVTSDSAVFCDSTTLTSASFAAAATGTYYVSFGGQTLQVSVTNGNPAATVTGPCTNCVPSFALANCGVSDVNEAGACTDASLNPKTLYTDCPGGVLDVGCGLWWDAALQFPVNSLYVFAGGSNWDMSGNGVIVAVSSVQC